MKEKTESAEMRLARFRQNLDHWKIRFGLDELSPFHQSARSLLLQGTRTVDQKQVIVKFPSTLHGARLEATALKAFANHGCVPLLDVDLDIGVLLLERIEPGSSLLDLFPDQDELALDGCLQLIRRLQMAHGTDLGPYTPLSIWVHPLFKPNSLDATLLTEIRKIANYLMESTRELKLLHGDLHHLNILRGTNGELVAIDPIGIVADEAFEASSFIIFPTPQLLAVPDLPTLLRRRIDHFADAMKLDRTRVQGWATVRALRLAAIEEKQHPKACEEWIRVALALLLL